MHAYSSFHIRKCMCRAWLCNHFVSYLREYRRGFHQNETITYDMALFCKAKEAVVHTCTCVYVSKPER